MNYNNFSKKEKKIASIKSGSRFGIVDCPNRLNLRSKPSLGSEILSTLKPHDKVEIIEEICCDDRSWYLICLASGVTGFVVSDFIKEE